jgi:polysaccharide pyruvyl transferase WcaK-like protein
MQERGGLGQKSRGPCPGIALLTPYDGGNLGDAAIQDSMIANLRKRIPGIRFLGITLNCDNFVTRHGGQAFPLLASTRTHKKLEDSVLESPNPGPSRWTRLLRRALGLIPGLLSFARRSRSFVLALRRELSHSFEAFRVLRQQDLLIVSGGGQLDEEWGGPWRFPFSLFKWALLARLAGVPFAVASVGACKITSRSSRRFLATALRCASYRSYRDANSRAIAATLLPQAAKDSVVPDLVFSMPGSEIPAPAGSIRELASGRAVVAISPIAYAKPFNWPTPDNAVHERYVQQMTRIVSALSRQGYFLVIVYSSLGDDQSVIPDVMGRLDDEVKQGLVGQIHFSTIKSWRDLVAVLRDSDYLVASRLHSTILGFVTQTPTVAISFDPKVDWVMQDLHQSDFLLHILDFTAEEAADAVDRIKVRRDAVVQQLASYRQRALSESARQYDVLAELSLAHCQSRN